ncbi:MAG: S8 family peptidase [Dysgonamonadaceae bacterium]|jgi:subtilisin family serine protease|nr:S8 family peptidase [Dysgonamonadaceae bacterium]
MKKIGCFLLVISAITVYSQPGMYRLQLTDKGTSPCSIDQPETFLSPKSIERRVKQNLPIDESDLPIDLAYFAALNDAGATVQTYSKWVATVVVNIPDEETLNRVSALPFVASVKKVRNDVALVVEEPEEINPVSVQIELDAAPKFGENYGLAGTHIALNNALFLHELGYKGAGITIAVIDAGFKDADLHPEYWNMNQILGTKNFTHQQEDLFRSPEQHGASVLSLILANRPDSMIGTAPEASFYLLKSEVNGEEFPVEEDYWVAALEYADSLGVDIVTTSLGYFYFTDPAMNHTWDELDGQTVPASRAGSMALSKGLVVLLAAGNEGRDSWQKSCIPSDAHNILTVGAVKPDSTYAAFSSWGRLADNRIKPDVMAQGQMACILLPSNNLYIEGRGTSYSTPILAGMTACLMQAIPGIPAAELIDLVKSSSDRYSNPDEHYGYGLPDFQKAYQMYYPTSINTISAGHSLFFDVTRKQLRLDVPEQQQIQFFIYSLTGQLVYRQDSIANKLNLSELQSGIYIAKAFSEGKSYACLFRVL